MRSAFLSIIVLSAASGCHSKSSEVRTVDNFAHEGATTPNSCGWDLKDKRMPQLRQYFSPIASRIVTKDATLRDVTYAVLAHTPRGIRISFFAIPGTTIELVSDVPKYCVAPGGKTSDGSAIEVSAEQQRFLQQMQKSGEINNLPGCWQTSTTKPPRVIIKADQKVIRHHLLRILAFVYTELLRKRVYDAVPQWFAKAPKELREFMNDMRTKQDYQRQQLATAFFKDISQGQGKGFRKASHAQTYQTVCKDPKLHSNPSKSLLGNDVVTVTNAKTLKNFYDQSEKLKNGEFHDYLFAEVVDSYFCSPDSYLNFANEFRLTYCTAVDGQIVQDLTKVGATSEFASSGQQTNKH